MIEEKHPKYSIDSGERAEQDDPHAMRQTQQQNPQLIEKSLTDSLDFEFYVGPWSACSQTCGMNDSGYRVSNEHTALRFLIIIINHFKMQPILCVCVLATTI
jgi:hypothetical protein